MSYVLLCIGAIQTLMEIIQHSPHDHSTEPADLANPLPRQQPSAFSGPPSVFENEEKDTLANTNVNGDNLSALDCAFTLMSLDAGVTACEKCPSGVEPFPCCEPFQSPNLIDNAYSDAREDACIVLLRLALDMTPARDICRLGGIVVLLGIIGNKENSLDLRDKLCAVLGRFCLSAAPFVTLFVYLTSIIHAAIVRASRRLQLSSSLLESISSWLEPPSCLELSRAKGFNPADGELSW